MAVKVVIKRLVDKKLSRDLDDCINALRMVATKQTGYFYGETLACLDSDSESVVISTWQSREHWDLWCNSTERIRIQQRIDALPGSRTEYEIFAY